jgi:hypothetical protein
VLRAVPLAGAVASVLAVPFSATASSCLRLLSASASKVLAIATAIHSNQRLQQQQQ